MVANAAPSGCWDRRRPPGVHRLRVAAVVAMLGGALAACGPAGPAAGGKDAGRASASDQVSAENATVSNATASNDPFSASAAEVSSPAGSYVREGRSFARLALAPDGDAWEIRLHAGGDPEDGAGIAADCEVHARGRLRNGRIDAAVVPFEGQTISVSAADLDASPASIVVALDGDVAQVESDFDGCSLGVTLGGRFQRED